MVDSVDNVINLLLTPRDVLNTAHKVIDDHPEFEEGSVFIIMRDNKTGMTWHHEVNLTLPDKVLLLETVKIKAIQGTVS
jgi:hypothetical protein